MLETGWPGGAAFILVLTLLLKQNWRLIKGLKGRLMSLLLRFLISFFAILVNIAVEASFEGVIFVGFSGLPRLSKSSGPPDFEP